MFNWDQSIPEQRRNFLKKERIYKLCSGLENYTLYEIEEAIEVEPEVYAALEDAIYFSKWEHYICNIINNN